MSNLSVIILAAGKGTRMKSRISKLLHKVGNLEMVNHVICSAKKLNAQEITIVCSEENIDEIKKNIDEKITTTIQYDRNGTGGAAKIGYDSLKYKDNDTLILYGDVPLVKAETYQKLVNTLELSDTSIVDLAFHTADIKNKYGRLMTRGNSVEQIIEYKDATDEVKNITLCNSGLMAIKGGLLGGFLSKLNDNNASKEYYLTDIIEIAQKQGLNCKYIIGTEDEVMGVNSRCELSEAEKIFQRCKRREFMDLGVTLIDPESVYFSSDTEIENDVVIEPNVTIMCNVKIAKSVKIKSFAYLENCKIKEGTTIEPFTKVARPIEGIDFEIIEGLPDELIPELIKNSLNPEDTELSTTSDRKRFNSIESINEWKKKGRTIYVLKDLKDKSLLGIFWFGKKELEIEKPEKDLIIDKTKYKHTFAMRLYGKLRGVGMFRDLTIKIMKKYMDSPNYDKTGFWGESRHGAMVRVCESLGMKQISAKKIDTTKKTSNLENDEAVFVIEHKDIKFN